MHYGSMNIAASGFRMPPPPPPLPDTRQTEMFGNGSYDGSVSRSPPDRPGTPQIIDLDCDSVTLAWLKSEFESPSSVDPSIYRGHNNSIDIVKQINSSAGIVNGDELLLSAGNPPLSFEGYQVQFREVGEPYWQLANAKSALDTQYTVRNLRQFGHYEFRIVAKNVYGFSPPSNASVSIKLRSKFVQNIATAYSYDKNAGFAPGRPRVVECDGANVALSWDPPVAFEANGSLVGYHVEYRVVGALDWITATNHLVRTTSCTVPSLRPNGLYEFRVFAKSADGVSTPSPTSAEFRVRVYSAPGYKNGQQASCSFDNFTCPDIFAPGKPEVVDWDTNCATIQWSVTPLMMDKSANFSIDYLVEYREAGQPNWLPANSNDFQPIVDNRFTMWGLNPSATYTFRVFARTVDGFISPPSEPSEPFRLNSCPRSLSRAAPSQPNAPEILQTSNDCVTIKWSPCRGSTSVHGYQVEFRDLTPNQQQQQQQQQPPHWLPVNPFLIQSCKMTIGDLSPGHEYDFRVIAKNDVGFSAPSEPSRSVIINFESSAPSPSQNTLSLSTVKEALVASSKPTNGGTGSGSVAYRDPTLPEVLEYLECTNNVLRLNATGYLQHLTYNDDSTKKKVRDLGGIPRLLQLLRVEVPEIQKNVCGCLKNLSFGVDENKKAILNAGGVTILTNLLIKTMDFQILDEIIGVISNLSSHEDLKLPILQNVVETLVKRIIIPYSCRKRNSNEEKVSNVDSRTQSCLFKGASGVLRNISSSGDLARKFLRENDHLIECLASFLRSSCQKGEFDTKSVENVVCVLRNLSYRLQETEDKVSTANGIDKHSPAYERSRSAPSGSPKLKLRASSKHKQNGHITQNGHLTNGNSATDNNHSPHPVNVRLLWSAELIKDYLTLLEQSTNPETLEASAGAIQNLAACHWQPSIELRAMVRKEKGLPILVQLLSIENDKVVCAVSTTLRNLSLDQRNLELIGKYAMEELIKKLPQNTSKFVSTVSEDTVAAVMSVIYATVFRSSEFAKSLLDKGGVQILIDLSSAQQYSSRVAKYANQILFCMWKYKELHEAFKKAGFREEHFVSKAAKQGQKVETLARLVSSQGVENKCTAYTSLVRPDLTDSNGKRANESSDLNSSRSSACSTGRLDIQGGRSKTNNTTSSHDDITIPYAQVQKSPCKVRNGSSTLFVAPLTNGAPTGADDSWV